MQFTACYTKLEEGFGYMGQLLEWPNVITDGKTLEECEEMLKDAAHEMEIVYKEDGLKIPYYPLIVKPISVPVNEGLLSKGSNLENASERGDIIRHFEAHGFFLRREGGNHSIYSDGKGLNVSIGRHNTFNRFDANKLCKEANIPQVF